MSLFGGSSFSGYTQASQTTGLFATVSAAVRYESEESDEESQVSDTLDNTEDLEERIKRYSGNDEELKYAALKVEDRKLYVSVDVLSIASPVFKAMFGASSFKEGLDREAELPGKSLKAIIWMLDFIYPDTLDHSMSDNKATILLPLACEYQIERLKGDCVTELQKMARPRLELVTLANKLDLKDLQDKAIDACVSHVNSSKLKKQLDYPENEGLPESIYIQILQKKLSSANSRHGTQKYL